MVLLIQHPCAFCFCRPLLFFFSEARTWPTPGGRHRGRNSRLHPHPAVASVQGHFELVIKVYPDGNVSSHMFGLKVGDTIEVRSTYVTFRLGLGGTDAVVLPTIQRLR